MKTNEFINDLGTSDYESWVLVQKAHLKNAYNEEIMECGFNKQTGYVYIALENGIQIASCFGQNVEYIKYNYKTDEELFYDEYTEALNN
jgi:hypothetical protein